MNVVRIENTLAPTRGRGGGRGRGRAGKFAPNSTPMINVPKYDLPNERQLLVNINPYSTNSMITPKNNTRSYQAATSSSGPKNTLPRRGGQSSSGNRISPHSISTELEQCVIIAITSGRGDARGEVGMAAIDVQYPHMILCQISDCNTYINTLTKIHTLNPIEIVMPDTMCERSIYANGLYHAIREKFESLPITPIARMHFHDTSGMDKIRTHCADEFSSVELFVKQKYYALAAASALLKYVEYIQHIVYAPKSMRIDFQASQNTTFIDIESAQCLELVASQDSGGGFSLLSSLDRCSTPMGRRLLRASILQPPCNLDLVKTRQNCVAELVANRPFHSIVKPVIKRLYGASRLLSLAILTSQADTVQAAEKNLNYVLLLKNIVDIIPELRSVIANGQAPFFQKVAEDLKDPRYQKIKELILSVIHAEAQSVMGFVPLNMQRCFAIRSGLNDMLDLARQTYCELIDDMQNYTCELAERYKLPLSLGCNASLGYHIEMDVRRTQNIRTNELPEELIEVHKQKSKIFMTTNCLLVIGQHCRDACAELHIMSNVLLNEILTKIRDHIGCLLKLSDNVGELDLLMSMAQVSSINDYVAPIFGQKLEVRDSRHPIMDISGNDSPVSNDIVATVAHNFNTITGPNMSGKSVYLKQIVLLQIMAQIGYYVPATKAQFRVADRIFCRMCSRNDIESDASTFVLEIKEAQYIVQSVTANSLVILDELCRGTTIEEGTSIAWSICETLLRTNAFTFNATHFLYLTRLAEFYYNVNNYYFETESNVSEATSFNDSRLIYTHKLKPGIASVWNYGIALARSTGLPDTIVALASYYADEIAKSVKPLITENETNLGKKSCYDCFVEMCGLLERDQFTANNLVELVNKYKIPSVMKELMGQRLMKEQEEVEIASSDITIDQKEREVRMERKEIKENESSSFRMDNFEHRNIEDVALMKRLSSTSISSDTDVKKPKIRSDKSTSRPLLSQFNYLRRVESKRNCDKSSRKTSPEMSSLSATSSEVYDKDAQTMGKYEKQCSRSITEPSPVCSSQLATSSEIHGNNARDRKHPKEDFDEQRTRANLINTQKERFGTHRSNRNDDESSKNLSSIFLSQSTTSSEVYNENSHSMQQQEKHLMDDFNFQRARAKLINTQNEKFETQRSNRNDYESFRNVNPKCVSQPTTSSKVHDKNILSMGQGQKQPMENFDDQRNRGKLMNTQKKKFGTQRSSKSDNESSRKPSATSQSTMSSEIRDKYAHSMGQNEKHLMGDLNDQRARENFINTQNPRFETERKDKGNYDGSLRESSPLCSSQSATSSAIPDKNSHSMGEGLKQPMENFNNQRARENLINTQKERFETQRNNKNDYESFTEPSPELIFLSGTSQSHCSQVFSASTYSQISTDTYIARITARKKEADVFRIIEGSGFDESAFYGSLHQSTIEIDSDEEFV